MSDQMEKTYRKILVIGATSRNLGKTGLACSLLGRFPDYPITAIKIKTLRPGDQASHGKGTHLTAPFSIRFEDNRAEGSDSGRLLQAGAKQVLYIKSHFHSLLPAFREALLLVPENHLMVIESNSIIELIRPAIYILIKGQLPEDYKDSALSTEHSADIILYSNGSGYTSDPDELPIGISESGWELYRARTVSPEF